VYILDADLDVHLQQEDDRLDGTASPPCRTPQAAELTLRQVVLPEVVKQVNSAPEYADLRAIYRSRVLAEWYRKERAGVGYFSDLINVGRATSWLSAPSWNPRDVFSRYLRSMREGEMNLTRTTKDGDYLVTRAYFYGGVDFSAVSLTSAPLTELARRTPDIQQALLRGLSSPKGYSSGGNVWLGGVNLAPRR
jgi:hypothetical protein